MAKTRAAAEAKEVEELEEGIRRMDAAEEEDLAERRADEEAPLYID